MTSRMKSTLKLLLPVLIVLLIAGCNKYLRLAELGGQFCSYEDNFNLVTADGAPDLTLFDPVMLESDMDAFLGVMPTFPQMNGETRETQYLFKSVSGDNNRLFQLGLNYTQDEDLDWRLSGITGDHYVAQIVPLSLIEQSLRSICSRDTSYSVQQIEFDLTLIDKNLIPNRAAIRDILGPPEKFTSLDEGASSHAHYEMRLINAPDGEGKLLVDFFFEENGDLIRNSVQINNTVLEADFDKGRAVLKLI